MKIKLNDNQRDVLKYSLIGVVFLFILLLIILVEVYLYIIISFVIYFKLLAILVIMRY